ncbi:GGDEF domain-containing protein [Marilutibacter spongiae]|uniref:diguanylate cyclase n=1 Tax=Marilutibacter spongiae TaxID=2025720 RepID=A0A7W3TLK4_9GAMM|nr:diguanylate cyclase [Lysobacter spongiae]MBB1060567.1 diguanylate cyclase [Lysobacter spongiae]
MHRAWYTTILLLLMTVSAWADAQDFDVARLGADPVPAQVVAGGLDADFVPVPPSRGQAAIVERARGISWWRVTAREPLAPRPGQSLVLNFPYMNAVQAWRPGDALPVRASLVGPDADLSHSTRGHFIPLPDGLARGESVYLRLQCVTPMRIALTVEGVREAHRKDLTYVGWRVGVLSTTLVLAVLVFGFWVGIGERSYLYLMLALFGQVLYLVSTGGDLRAFESLSALMGQDLRASRIFALAAFISSNSFMAYYLDLVNRQPRVNRVLTVCSLAALALIGWSVFSVSGLIPTLANTVVLVAIAAVIWAMIVAVGKRQNGSLLLVFAMMPLVLLVALRAAVRLEMLGMPPWLDYVYPAGFMLSGLIVTIGLTGKMHQLRRDRDHASHMASYDALTGANSRPVIESHLRNAVAEAHDSGAPLSVVFFDIDNFKRINDQHGHRAGDECLKLVAMRTRNRLRTYDQIGRYGGDEMIVILPDTALKEAIGVAENLRSAVNCRPIATDDLQLDVTLSLGVAQLLPDESAEALLERADAALYASKSAGRDQVTGHIRSMLQAASGAPR